VQRRDHDRLAVSVDDAEVGDQRLVEDRVDDLALVAAPLALAANPDAIGRWVSRHGRSPYLAQVVAAARFSRSG
jgi:hypothetical protein